MRESITIRVTGTVQDVGFRYRAWQEARSLGLVGFVRNEPDGSVCLEAEGERAALDSLVAWCRKGPSSADVRHIEVSENHQPKHFSEFVIA